MPSSEEPIAPGAIQTYSPARARGSSGTVAPQCLGAIGAHHSRDRVAIGDADAGMAEQAAPSTPSRGGATRRAGKRSWWWRRVRHSRSCEEPVQEPARLAVLAPVTDLAENPEAPAGGVLHAKIIAGLLRAFPPPFAGDPLRPFGAGDLVEARAASEKREAGHPAWSRRGHGPDGVGRRSRSGPGAGAGLAGAAFRLPQAAVAPGLPAPGTARSPRGRGCGCPARRSEPPVPPKRTTRRSTRSATASSSTARPSRPGWTAQRLGGRRRRIAIEAEAGIERIGEGVEPFAESRRMAGASREGRPVSTGMRRTAPSDRKKPARSCARALALADHGRDASMIAGEAARSRPRIRSDRLGEAPLDPAVGQRPRGPMRRIARGPALRRSVV